MAFSRKLALDVEEMVQRQRLESAADERRDMLESGVDEDFVDMVLTRSELWELRGIERNLRLRREMNGIAVTVSDNQSTR